MLRIDKLYEILLKLHAALPYKLGNGFALPLLKIGLELTYRCNMKCIFCFQQELRGKKETNELSADEFIKFISQIPWYTLITFTGGEPFIKKDNLEIIKHALKKHWCNIITNGVMMTEEHAKTFVDNKLVLLGVSIDGIGKSHDQVRGLSGAYDKIIHNVKLLQEYKKRKRAKYPRIDIKTVIIQENLDMLEDIYQSAVDLDADFLTLSLLKGSPMQYRSEFMGNLKDDMLYASSPVEPYVDPKEMVRKISKIMEMSRGKKMKVRLYPMTLQAQGMETYFDNTRELIHRYKPCMMPWSGLMISPMGDAYPCIVYKVGNIRESSLKSIWNSSRYREFRRKLSVAGLFPSCVGCCLLYERPRANLAN